MSKSNDFIKKYRGDTPTASKKNTDQQSNKTAGSVATSFIKKYKMNIILPQYTDFGYI